MSSEVAVSEAKEGYERVQLGPRTLTLPEEWEICPVKELFEIDKVSFDPSELDADSEVMLYSMPAYDSNREPIQTLASEIGSKKYRVPKNTILFPKLNIRKRRFWRVEHDHSLPAVCSTEYWPLLPKKKLELDFYHYYFDSYEFISNPKVSSASSTNSHKRVNQSSFEKLQLPVPTLSEQRRIADILSMVDEQIQQTNKIIEITKELKHGLRQDLVFGKGFSDDCKSVRLGARNVEIPSNWEVTTFSDIAAVEKGNTPKTSNSDYYGGDNVWVTPDDLSNMYDRGEKYISDSRRKLTDAGLESTSVDIVPAPSVMFTSRSYGIGKTAICTVPAATNQGIIAFSPKERIGTEYLYYYLNQIMDYIIAISGVSNFPEVSLTDIRKLSVPIPSKEDQEQIESVLKLVDQKLVEEQNTKQHLKELKRGLMQDLLTGNVRVDAD